MKEDVFKPGMDNKPAGTYHETGVNGEKLVYGRTIEIETGERLPPTQKPNRGWTK